MKVFKLRTDRCHIKPAGGWRWKSGQKGGGDGGGDCRAVGLQVRGTAPLEISFTIQGLKGLFSEVAGQHPCLFSEVQK